MTSGESRLLHRDILHRYLERRDAGDLRGGLVAELAAERGEGCVYVAKMLRDASDARDLSVLRVIRDGRGEDARRFE